MLPRAEAPSRAMLTFLSAARAKRAMELPLFPLQTVLFPGGILPLKVFEQRYIEMTKSCLRDGAPSASCLVTRGRRSRPRRRRARPPLPRSARPATITSWDMPRAGHPAHQRRGRDALSRAVARDARRRPRRRHRGGHRRRAGRRAAGRLRAARAPARSARRARRTAALPGQRALRRRVMGRLPSRRAAAAAAADQADDARGQRQRESASPCCRSSCSSRDCAVRRAPAQGRPRGIISSSISRERQRVNGGPQQMGEHQAPEGGDGRQARQDLHPPHQGNHRRGAPGRRRLVDESAPAPRDRQGDGEQHAEGHDRARGQARRRRARGRQLRGNPLRGLRHQRRRGDRRLHDRQPHAHRRRRPACLLEVRRQSRHRRLGRVPVQALRADRVRARHRREQAARGGARRRRRGRRHQRRRQPRGRSPDRTISSR